jgi:hypothetical protein
MIFLGLQGDYSVKSLDIFECDIIETKVEFDG